MSEQQIDRSCEDRDSDGVIVLRGIRACLEQLSYLLFFGHKNIRSLSKSLVK